jgi:molecular chaperone DnaJ
MNRKDAYIILGADENSSQDELKAKFRKLAKQLHPDNKETGDEAKFKQLNEAYNRLSNNDFPEENQQFGGGFPFDINNIDDVFTSFFGGNGHPFGNPFNNIINVLEVSINVPYEVSIKGGKANISISRNKKCDSCSGKGGTPAKNACKSCGGTGIGYARVGNVVMRSTCSSCHGKKTPLDKCNVCNGVKYTTETATLKLDIPPGVITGNVMRICGAGNWAGSDNFGRDVYGDIHIKIEVAKHEQFTTQGNDVHSVLSVDLIDAIKGCKKIVNTVYGEAEITIPVLSKHCDKAQIINHGVGGKGNHVITLNVNYPENVEKLIEALS